MTERQIYAFNRIAHVELIHPGLIKNNINILKKYNIDKNISKTGPGFDVLVNCALEERLKTINEMGLMEEVLENREESLEIIRRFSLTSNYNDSKDAHYVKGVA